MGVDIHTVRNYLRSATFPERQQRCSPDKGSLAPYKEYLERRWQEGCQNALELYREVKAQGFPGWATAVRDFVRPFRDPNLPPAVLRERRSIPSPRSLAWLLVSQGKLSQKKQDLVDKLCCTVPALAQGCDLVVAFKDMLRRRASEEFEGWLESAKGSGLLGFSSFVRGIRSDYAAVRAAFSLEWSNGHYIRRVRRP